MIMQLRKEIEGGLSLMGIAIPESSAKFANGG